MDLKEALERAERFPDCLGDGGNVADAIMAAARRELERQEAGKPKRASLNDLATCLRDHSKVTEPYFNCRSATCRVGARDWEALLGALRNQMVPWLRQLRSAPECMNARDTRELRPGWEKRRCPCCHRLVLHEGGLLPEAIIEALGEPL